jgi:hypothetical protein
VLDFNTNCFVDDIDDKENEISDYCSMDTTFDLPCQSNLSSYAGSVKDNKNGRRKRSFYTHMKEQT